MSLRVPTKSGEAVLFRLFSAPEYIGIPVRRLLPRGACAEPFDKLRINSSEALLAKTGRLFVIK